MMSTYNRFYVKHKMRYNDLGVPIILINDYIFKTL